MGATPKQRAFARAIVEGMNPSEAYIEAYGAVGSKPETVAVEAQRLMKNPNVSPIIERGREEAARAASWSLATALERLSEANQTAFEAMREQGPTKEVMGAFFGSLDRLNRLSGVDRQASDLASAEALRRSFELDY